MSNQPNDVNVELLAKITETTKEINNYKKARKDQKKQLGGGAGKPTDSFSLPKDIQLCIVPQHI
jgi:hypothetical protein